MLGGLGVTALFLLIAVLVYQPSPDSATPAPRPRPRPPGDLPSLAASGEQRGADPSATVAAASAPQGYELVDDERLLWAPPYLPQPVAPRDLLPPGPGIIATVRLSRWVDDSVGRDLVDVFSPELEGLISAVEMRTKVSAASIRRLSIALHPGEAGWPEISLGVELEEPLSLTELIDRWRVAESRTPEGHQIYAGEELGGDAYYVRLAGGDDDFVASFAVGMVDRITEVAEMEGHPIPFSQNLERLWNRTSDQADLTVLLTPNFLFADARRLLEQLAPSIIDPLRELLIPNASGWLLSVAVDGDSVYAESRMLASGETSESQLLHRFRQLVASWPEWAEGFLVRSVADPSWRLLATRLPLMYRFVGDQTRYGVSDGAAVANVYLPTQGLGQLGLATLLTLNMPASVGVDPVETTTSPMTLDQMLEREMSISFDQESLEFAVEAIVDEFARSLPSGAEAPQVRILGGDLEKSGITQNQQVRDFKRRNLPLRRVLTDLVLGANPDRTATGPEDPKQSLIWVTADDPDRPGRKAVLITTREAAAGQYELPIEFRSPP